GKGCINRARALLVDSQGRFWVGTEQGVYRFGPEFGGWKRLDSDTATCRVNPPWCPSNWQAAQAAAETDSGWVGFATYSGTATVSPRVISPPLRSHELREEATTSLLARPGNSVLTGTLGGLVPGWSQVGEMRLGGPISVGTPLRHTWFRRPIALTDQPFIDQTYRYGSTMGGYFQQHQGVEFNNPDGTPVMAALGGKVVYAGPAEAGARTVAIRHDTTVTAHGTRFRLYSIYYHNSSLAVKVGDRV